MTAAGDDAASVAGDDGEIAWDALGIDLTPPQYPYDRLMEEAAFIAYHFHWDMDRILGLEHAERRRWAEEISRINGEINEQSGALIASV